MLSNESQNINNVTNDIEIIQHTGNLVRLATSSVSNIMKNECVPNKTIGIVRDGTIKTFQATMSELISEIESIPNTMSDNGIQLIARQLIEYNIIKVLEAAIKSENKELLLKALNFLSFVFPSLKILIDPGIIFIRALQEFLKLRTTVPPVIDI